MYIGIVFYNTGIMLPVFFLNELSIRTYLKENNIKFNKLIKDKTLISVNTIDIDRIEIHELDSFSKNELLKLKIKHLEKDILFTNILNKVSKITNISISALLTKKNTIKKINNAKFVLYKVLYELWDNNYYNIGLKLNKTHTTIINGINKFKENSEAISIYNTVINEITK